MIYELNFRGSGGSVVPGLLSNYPERVTEVKTALMGYEQIIFLIHGFNVEEQAGRDSLSHLAGELDRERCAVVFVLWPGDSPVGPLSYSFTEGNQANDTALQIARFIENHIGHSTMLNFVAHSLGCRVTLETLNRLNKMAGAARDSYPVNQVCLFAAAVDNYCLALPEEYKNAVQRTQRTVVLSSVEDTVLKFIYPAGDLLQSFIYFWKESFGFALGYSGPRKIITRRKFAKTHVKRKTHDIASNVCWIIIDKKYGVDHGDYLPPADNTRPSDKQKTAAHMAKKVLAGESELVYKIDKHV